MYRPPVNPQRSPGAPRPSGRFPSPPPVWGFPGARSPHAGSPWSQSPYSPGSPGFSPGSSRGYSERSQGGFGNGSRGYGGQTRHRGDGFRWPRSFSPSSANPYPQSRPSDDSVEKYFSPSMLEDPWKTLQPITAADAAAVRRAS